MARTVARTIAAPLLFLNLIMYLIVLGFASWCLNRHGRKWSNGALSDIRNTRSCSRIVSKIAGGNHLRAWRNDSLAAAGSSSIVAWAVTMLALGLACKEINVGGWRGWRLRVLEGFTIVLGFTQLLYVLLLHAGFLSSKYGPGYREPDYGLGAPGAEPRPKGVVTRAVKMSEPPTTRPRAKNRPISWRFSLPRCRWKYSPRLVRDFELEAFVG
ncbi:hypothetical protein DH2020_043487 [Rehmannia glutinosa]|uniref:Uncharacterized protein n=1 Tax=Rehmannia glutinosa TaxID=99300 RepID=A0ABR0UJH0_REHGL